MAISKNNIVTQGFSGMLANRIVFRQLRGKTIIANRPAKPSRQSELQRANRHRFRKATAFAHAAMRDPQQKAYYWKKANELKLPNAYTAAITDYMRRPLISHVEAPAHNGNPGNRGIITAGKKEFALKSVEVNFIDETGVSLGTSAATLINQQKDRWVFHLPDNISANVTRIIITAKDAAGNASCVHHETRTAT